LKSKTKQAGTTGSSAAETRSEIVRPARTELVWEGKYYADGKRSAPLHVTLPFQTVETVNESAADRRRTLELFGQHRQSEWRNRLIWGDKKYVLPPLPGEFAGKVNLIYIDPPFFTGTDQLITITVPDSEHFVVKEPSISSAPGFRPVDELDQIEDCAGLRQTRSTQKATSFWRVYSLLATAASATLVLVATAIVRDCGHVLA
jgi:hypothetical protein